MALNNLSNMGLLKLIIILLITGIFLGIVLSHIFSNEIFLKTSEKSTCEILTNEINQCIIELNKCNLVYSDKNYFNPVK